MAARTITKPNIRAKLAALEEKDLPLEVRVTLAGVEHDKLFEHFSSGEEYKFRTLADLSRLAIEQSISGPRALPGRFLVESRKWVNESPDEDSPFVPVPIQYEEKLETPEGMIARLVRTHQMDTPTPTYA